MLFNEVIDTEMYLCLVAICTRLRGNFGGGVSAIRLRVGVEGELK